MCRTCEDKVSEVNAGNDLSPLSSVFSHSVAPLLSFKLISRKGFTWRVEQNEQSS